MYCKTEVSTETLQDCQICPHTAFSLIKGVGGGWDKSSIASKHFVRRELNTQEDEHLKAGPLLWTFRLHLVDASPLSPMFK